MSAGLASAPWVPELAAWEGVQAHEASLAGAECFSLTQRDGRGPVHRRASSAIGFFPYHPVPGAEISPGVLTVVPKGARAGDEGSARKAMLRFSQLIALGFGGPGAKPVHRTDPDWTWDADGGPAGRMVLLLAGAYAASLTELCHRDFRRYYRREEGTLTGRVRGRLQVARHVGMGLRGRAHQLPCAWEEFTADNWDNRLLAAAVEGLVAAGGRLSQRGGLAVRALFRGTAASFADVDPTGVSAVDLPRARLHTVSSHYRRALALAGLLLRGMGAPRTGIASGAVWLDANLTFERFAERIVERAVELAVERYGRRLRAVFNEARGGLLADGPSVKPDLLLRTPDGAPLAVGDAKYKDIAQGLADDAAAVTFSNGEVTVKLKSADLYQLYAYMRLTQAPFGFFVVPCWAAGGPAAAWAGPAQSFVKTPMDGEASHRIRVLLVNLMLEPAKALEIGAGLLAEALRTG